MHVPSLVHLDVLTSQREVYYQLSCHVTSNRRRTHNGVLENELAERWVLMFLGRVNVFEEGQMCLCELRGDDQFLERQIGNAIPKSLYLGVKDLLYLCLLHNRSGARAGEMWSNHLLHSAPIQYPSLASTISIIYSTSLIPCAPCRAPTVRRSFVRVSLRRVLSRGKAKQGQRREQVRSKRKAAVCGGRDGPGAGEMSYERVRLTHCGVPAERIGPAAYRLSPPVSCKAINALGCGRRPGRVLCGKDLFAWFAYFAVEKSRA